jgi:hypothetical protein
MTRLYDLQSRVVGNAAFSTNGRYRYWLERHWDRSLPHFTFVLLNPSAADADRDDGTTRNLCWITMANGGGGYELVNLFAVVDTRQTALHRPGSIGESRAANDGWIHAAVDRSERLVVGWGKGSGDPPHAAARQRAVDRRAVAVWPTVSGRELWCVGTNKGGSPRHPARVGKHPTLERYVPTSHRPATG